MKTFTAARFSGLYPETAKPAVVTIKDGSPESVATPAMAPAK